MASQHFSDVLVTLLEVGNAFDVPLRELFLSPNEPSIIIGRSSKRDLALAASRDNAWVDSPVVSRHHAELAFDHEQQTVTIEDLASLHGTFHNGNRIEANVPQQLVNGDIISMGVDIEHGIKQFKHCTMEVAIEYGVEKPTSLDNGPLVFQVPDDSDIEDSDAEPHDDDEDASIAHMQTILQEHGLSPKSMIEKPDPNTSVPIELLDDSDEDASIGDDEHISPNTTPPTSSPAKALTDICQAIETVDEANHINGEIADSLFGSTPELAGEANEHASPEEVLVAATKKETETQPQDHQEPATPPTPEVLKADQNSKMSINAGEVNGIVTSEPEPQALTSGKATEVTTIKVPQQEISQEDSRTGVPAKRKACEISGEAPADIPCTRSPNDGDRAQISEKKVKIFRHVAEALGFATVGGAIVMYALISSAPAL